MSAAEATEALNQMVENEEYELADVRPYVEAGADLNYATNDSHSTFQ
jgi:hypothetical protein